MTPYNGLLWRYPALSRAIAAGTCKYGYPLYLAILSALAEGWAGR
jgi:hypothetical protein